MAACINELSAQDSLVAIKAVITNLSHTEEEVVSSITELASLLYTLAQHSSSQNLRNTTFSLGIVKALLGIMGSSAKIGLLTKALQCTAFLVHGNDEARVRLGKMGIIPTLLKLLSPLPAANDPYTSTPLQWCKDWTGVYEQCLIVLRKLTFHNLDNQQQLAQGGGLKLIIDLSMYKNILQNSGCFSMDAKKCLHQLTLGKKLICRATPVPEICRGAVLKSFLSLSDPGLTLSAQYPAFYIELATKEEKWIEHAMIEKGVVWPDHTPFPEQPKWTCVSVTNVEDGGHIWCQFCTEKPNPKVESLKESLMKLKPPSSEPIVSSTTVGDVYATFYDPSLSKEPCCLSSAQWCRTRLIGSGSPDSPVSNVKVLAVDFGFTMTVPLTHVAPLPMECRGIPPQAIPCKLIHIAPLPVSFVILENAAAVLCNMSFERYAYRCEIKTFKGIEALLNLVQCPHLAIIELSVGALVNMSLSVQLRNEIGKRGAVHLLLSLCRRHCSSDDLLEWFLSALIGLVTDCNSNLVRLIQDKDSCILSEILTQVHTEKVLRCASKLFHHIEPYAVASCHRPALVHHTNAHKHASPGDRTRSAKNRSSKSVYRCLGDEQSMEEEEIDRHGNEDHNENDLLSEDSWWEVSCETSGSISTKKHYLVGTIVTQAEMDDTQVCINVEDISTLAKRPVIRAVCALKNTGKHSKIFLGVRKNGQVCGVRMDRSQRDKLCVGIGEIMTGFTPYIEPSQYHLLFVPVVFQSSGQRADCFIVELTLKKSHYPQVYTITEKEDGQSFQRCYYRVAGRNDRLSCQELRDTVAWEEAHRYELQIKELEENISKLETLLTSSTQCT